MKAIILAGGRGTRLRPITHTKNKHMIPIGGVPMILRVLKDVVDLGITEIFVNINKGDKEIRDFLGDGKEWGVNLTYMEQEIPNGMMYPILMAKEMLGDDDFILHAGDNILSGGLKKYYKEFLEKKTSAHLLVTKVKQPERFGVAVIKDGYVVKTIEKPKEFISDLAVTGIYFYKKEIITAMENVKPIITGNSSIAEYYPPLPHQWLIENDYKVSYSECTGWWKDTGKPEDLIAANHLVLESLEEEYLSQVSDTEVEGKIHIGKNSIVKNCTLRGPIFIGDECTIEDSYIGPYTAISNNSKISYCEIENSIIMNSVEVIDLKERIDSSLIGDNCKITPNQSKPRGVKLFIGENSTVKL